jgi:hypothetical protein
MYAVEPLPKSVKKDRVLCGNEKRRSEENLASIENI